MVVHPAPGNWSHTFVNALLYHCEKLSADKNHRPGIVHRLDKNTSGVLLAAKRYDIQDNLITLFSERKIKKEYLAICQGTLKDQVVSCPIKRHPKDRKKMAIISSGKEAVTELKLLAYDKNFSLILARPFTGRTHQIRLHLKHLNCPVIGDELYGKKIPNVKRQYLHASKLEFQHPVFKKLITIKAPLFSDMKNFINSCFGEKSLLD